MWDLYTIFYSKSEPGLLIAEGTKWQNGTPNGGWREYIVKQKIMMKCVLKCKKSGFKLYWTAGVSRIHARQNALVSLH